MPTDYNYIRARWGYLWDNTASFTSLDLSGQASSIISTISGQTIPASVSGQISGFNLNPTLIIASSGLTAPVVSGTTGTFTTLNAKRIQSFQYLVYLDSDGGYKARNNMSGTIEFSGLLGAVVSSALVTISGSASNVRAGSIRILPGDLYLESGFAGWDLPRWTNIIMDRGTFINVPTNYSGYVFRMTDTTAILSSYQGTTVEGGYIRESGQVNGKWDAILIQSIANQGVLYCDVKNVTILNAQNGIHLSIPTSGATNYINDINIYDITPINCVNSVFFDLASGSNAPASYGFNRNLFVGVRGQTSSGTAYGFKNIGPGSQNTFIECKQSDISLGASGAASTTANIVSGASNTLIIGGVMTSLNFVDQGQETQVWDDIRKFVIGSAATFNGSVTISGNLELGKGLVRISGGSVNILNFSQAASGLNLTTYLVGGAGSGSNVSLSLWNDSSLDSRFFFQKTYTATVYNSVRQTAGGNICPQFFQIQDVVAGTLLEPMRLDISGNVILNNSGGTVLIRNGITVSGAGVWQGSGGFLGTVIFSGATNIAGTTTHSGNTNFAGTNILSGTTGIFGLSGLNWTGVATSGGVSGGSGASFSGMIPQGYINLQISGGTFKVPFFN